MGDGLYSGSLYSALESSCIFGGILLRKGLSMKIKNSKISMLAGSAALALISAMPAHATATFAGNAYTASDGVLTIIQVGVNGVAISSPPDSGTSSGLAAAANANVLPSDPVAGLSLGASTVETTYTTPPSKVVSSALVPSATITVGVNLGDISPTLGSLLSGVAPNLLNDTVTITAENLTSGAEADTSGSAATGNITSLGISDSLGLLSIIGSGSLSANGYALPNTDLGIGLNPAGLETAIGDLPAGGLLNLTLDPLLNAVGTVDILNLILNEQGTIPGYTESAYDNAIDLNVLAVPSLGLDTDQLIVDHSAAGVSNGDPAPAPEPSGLVVSLAAFTMLAGLVCIRKKSTLAI